MSHLEQAVVAQKSVRGLGNNAWCRVTDIASSAVVRIDDVIELEVGKVGNGGIFISRHEGKIVFVRGAIDGERVMARVTAINAKWIRADVVEVLVASDQRTVPPCQYAQSCGGCDFQHVRLSHQRDLKRQILVEQLSHLGGVELVGDLPLSQIVVEPMPEETDGLRWRTRMRFQRGSDTSVAMLSARSKSLVDIHDCQIAADDAVAVAQSAKKFVKAREISVVTVNGSSVPQDSTGGPMIDEQVFSRTWHMKASSFWQIHRKAPETFVTIVQEFAQLSIGQSALDLYSGSGLFAAFLAKDVGATGTVVAVESSIDAVRNARRSCSDLAQLELVTSDVSKWLSENSEKSFDVVVLDPPRTGAGDIVCVHVAQMAARAIVYVACEPSALARDTATLVSHGWTLTKLRALDAFPMTSHFESIALFERTDPIRNDPILKPEPSSN